MRPESDPETNAPPDMRSARRGQGAAAARLASSGRSIIASEGGSPRWLWADNAQKPYETAVFGTFLSLTRAISGVLKIRPKRSKTRLRGWDHERIYRPPADHSWSVAGPAMGPSKPLSSLFVSLFGVLWIAEKSSKKTVDGKTARGLYPAPHANGAALMAGTDAADSRSKGHCS